MRVLRNDSIHFPRGAVHLPGAALPLGRPAVCRFAFAGLTSGLVRLKSSSPREWLFEKAAQGIRPGEVRNIQKECGRWKDGFYYVPPAVLVLDKIPDSGDAFRVAQVFPDTGLAGPGDLIVNRGGGGAADFMVECWNSYTMKGSHLGPAYEVLGDEDLAAALDLEKNPETRLPGKPEPPPMEENDVRLFFRELEVEVAYQFSSSAVAELMAELEEPEPWRAYDSVEEMVADTGRKIRDLVWPEVLGTPEEALAAVRLPSERYKPWRPPRMG